jgi:D-alanyl-D-alanine carboxypeptidase
VRFTNSLPATPIKTEEEQPLPASPQAAKPDAKSELRVSAARAEREPNASASRPVGIAAIAPAPESKPPAQRPIPAATAAPAPAAKPLAAVSPKPAPKATPPRVGWVIQLAAAESEAKARGILDSAREKGGRLLKDAEPFTQSVSKGNTTLYRARFAGFDARDEADQACKQLKRSGFSCFSQKL